MCDGCDGVRPRLGGLGGGAVFGVAVALKVEGGEGADVANARDVHAEVAHEGQDGWRTLGQREVQHEGRQHDAGHLLQKQQRLRRPISLKCHSAGTSPCRPGLQGGLKQSVQPAIPYLNKN